MAGLNPKAGPYLGPDESTVRLVDRMVEAIDAARRVGRFDLADELRAKLAAVGIEVRLAPIR